MSKLVDYFHEYFQFCHDWAEVVGGDDGSLYEKLEITKQLRRNTDALRGGLLVRAEAEQLRVDRVNSESRDNLIKVITGRLVEVSVSLQELRVCAEELAA